MNLTNVLVALAPDNAKGLVLGAAAVKGAAEGDCSRGPRQLPVNVMLNAAIGDVQQEVMQFKMLR